MNNAKRKKIQRTIGKRAYLIDKKNRFIVNLNNYTSFLLFGFEKHVVTISDTLTESIKNSTASEFINTIYFYTTVFDIGLVKNGTSRR